jgi:hypothetical protein
MCGEKIQEMKSERIIQRLSSEVVTRFMTILEAIPTWAGWGWFALSW